MNQFFLESCPQLCETRAKDTTWGPFAVFFHRLCVMLRISRMVKWRASVHWALNSWPFAAQMERLWIRGDVEVKSMSRSPEDLFMFAVLRLDSTQFSLASPLSPERSDFEFFWFHCFNCLIESQFMPWAISGSWTTYSNLKVSFWDHFLVVHCRRLC